jgi:hypothetical protein
MAPRQGCKDTQCGEDGGRGADRSVCRWMEQRVERVAQGTGEKNGQPCKASAEELGEQEAEQAPEDEIAGQVAQVGVQAKGGEISPPLAIDDEARLRRASRPPVVRERLPARRPMQE